MSAEACTGGIKGSAVAASSGAPCAGQCGLITLCEQCQKVRNIACMRTTLGSTHATTCTTIMPTAIAALSVPLSADDRHAS
jgi:nicotinamide mononucleotide (NMN) deamidase PncC